MKRILTAALASLGIASAASAEPQVSTVDPRTVRFSMPTVAAEDIQFVMPSPQTFEGAPQFHEDEWCQSEFFPASRIAEMKARLTEYKAFEQRHRASNGWTEIYARRIARSPVLSGGKAVVELQELLKASILPAPILTTAARPLGQVGSGYTLRLEGSVLLYGISGESGLESLGAIVGGGGDDQQLMRAFTTLNKKYKLVLVDWRQQFLLVEANSAGKIDIWRP